MSVRSSFWDKKNKRSVYKSVRLDDPQFEGDREKAIQFLKQWKEENEKEQKLWKEEQKKNKKNDLKQEQKEESKSEPPKEESKEESKPEPPKEEPKPEQPKEDEMKMTPFKLEIPAETGQTLLICGSSKSGKTTQLLEIIEKYYDNKDYITILIAENIHSKVYSGLSKNILKMNYFDEELLRGLHRVNRKLKNKYKFCIIFDDVILHKNSSMIMSLVCTMRNAMFSTVLLFQSIQMLAKTNRQNINGCIMKRQNNAEAIELIMRDYLGGYKPFYGKSMEQKINLYRKATSEYKFIYLNNLSDEIFFCK